MGMNAQGTVRVPRLLAATLLVGMLASFLPVSPASAQTAVIEVNCPAVGAIVNVDVDPGPGEIIAQVTCVLPTPIVLVPPTLAICVFLNINVPVLGVTTTVTVAVGTGCPAYPLNASNAELAGRSAVKASTSGPGSPSEGAPEWLVVTAALGLLVAVNAVLVGGIARRRRLTRIV